MRRYIRGYTPSTLLSIREITMSKNIFSKFIQYLYKKETVSIHNLKRLCFLLDFYEKNPPQDLYEKHHIIPKSWNKEFANIKENIVKLPIRVHFIIHRLMIKAFPKDKAMTLAYWRMINSKKYKLKNSREYEIIKKEYKQVMSELLKGRESPTKGMTFERSDETCQRISAARKGSKAWNKGLRLTENQKKNMRKPKKIDKEKVKIIRSETVKKRVNNGTHHFLNTVSAFNVETHEIKRISKDLFENSTIWVSTFCKNKYLNA